MKVIFYEFEGFLDALESDAVVLYTMELAEGVLEEQGVLKKAVEGRVLFTSAKGDRIVAFREVVRVPANEKAVGKLEEHLRKRIAEVQERRPKAVLWRGVVEP